MRDARWIISAMVGAALSMATVAVQAEEVTITAINFVPNNHAFGAPFAEWVEKVNEEGAGTIKIDLKASAGMSPFKMGDAIRDGAFDLANLPATFYQNLVPIGDAMKLAEVAPQGPDEPDPSWEWFNGIHEERANMHYLTSWGWGTPFHAYFRKGGPSPETIRSLDWSGLKMRITPVYRAFFKALNADVVQIPPPEVVTSLERGTVDGYGWPIWDIQTPGWVEHTAYRVDPGVYTVTVGIVMNLDTWNQLSDEQKDILQSAAWEFAWNEYQAADEKNQMWADRQAEDGVEVIRLEGETAQTYIDTAYEAGWAEAEQLAPEDAAKLRELVDK